MLSTLASLLAVMYVPGAIIYRLPIADRGKRAALLPEERVFWAVMLSVCVTTTFAIALAALDIYSLRLLVTCNVVFAMVLAMASLGNLRLASPAHVPSWTAALPAALLAAGVWMYFAVPASEWVLGGRDPGVYVNQGIQIAQRQSLVTVDHVAAAVPASSRDLFFPYSEETGYYSLRYMGFLLRDPSTGVVTGQFPQGYPIWIAIAYGLDGVTGTRRVTAWWALLGVLALYFAAARLIGRVPAAAAAGLLTVHVLQTWYARYPNSEMVLQALLFGALTAHAYAHEEDDRFFGPLAATLLGLAVFTRFEAVLAVGAAGAASLLAPVNGKRVRAGFLITLFAWMGAAALYYMTQLRPYFSRPIGFLQTLDPLHVAALVLGIAAVLGLVWAIRRPRIAAATRRWLPIALAVVVVVEGVYALYFREPGGLLAPHDAHALRVFVYLYFTPIAFGLALLGYALLTWRSFWRAPALFLAVTALSLFFLYKMRIWPENFWLARRYVPVILPGAMMGAAGALFAPLWLRMPMGSDPRTVRVFGAIGVVGVLLLGQHYYSKSAPIRTHIEYADVIPRLERLAGMFGDNDLVLVEGRAASDLHTIALPLSYIWARNVLGLYSSRPDKPQLAEFLVWARAKYDHVYFLGGGGTDLLAPGINVETVKSEAFTIPQYEITDYATYPKEVRRKPFALTVYRFVDGSTGDEGAFRIDVGGADDLHVIRFHGKERWGGTGATFRWTRDRSYFSVPKVVPQNHELVLRMSNGGRPAKAPPAKATIALDNRIIGTASPDGEFRDYTFTIPPDLAAALARKSSAAEIRIESTTWTPRAVLGVPDDRQLGVIIDSAEIR